MNRLSLLAWLAATVFSLPVAAEDGYDLWLRYRPVETGSYAALDSGVRELVTGARSPTLAAAERELSRGLSGLAGRPIPLTGSVTQPGAVLFGTPASSPLVAGL